MKKIHSLETTKEQKSARFYNQFNINEGTRTVHLNAQLCSTMAVFEKLLKSKKIRYQDLGITGVYYKKFKQQVIKGLDAGVKELYRFSKILPTSDNSVYSVIDHNNLDYLEGLIKSAVDNKLISWHQIGFDNVDLFNEALENIRDLIDLNTELNFLEPLDNYTGLKQFESDGKINGDYNQWPDDCITKGRDVIKTALQITERRGVDEEHNSEFLDDGDLETVCKHCLTSVPYLTIKIPD